MKIKIYKNSFIRQLMSNIEENLSHYRSGNFSWTLDPENESNLYELDVTWFDEEGIQALNEISGSSIDQVADARDAKVLYKALSGMPSELARDGRIWATLCHTHCAEYVRKRNYKFIYASKNEDSVKAIKSRYFIENIRSFERTNGLARLWWFGRLVDQTGLSFEEAMETQLSYTDFRAGTLERPEVFSHKEIRSAVLDVAMTHKAAGDEFFRHRETYRPLFGDITERATRIFFPAMSHDHLTNFVEQRLTRLRESKK